MKVARTAFFTAIGAGLIDLGWSFVIKIRTMLMMKIVEQVRRMMMGTVRIHMKWLSSIQQLKFQDKCSAIYLDLFKKISV